MCSLHTNRAARRPRTVGRAVGVVALVGLFALAGLSAACTSSNDDLSGAAVRQSGGGQPMPDSIGGTVWHDVDGDGYRGVGENAVKGATVALRFDDDGDGVCDAGVEPIAQSATDAAGVYLFEGVPPGAYCVEATDASNDVPLFAADTLTLDGQTGQALDLGVAQ